MAAVLTIPASVGYILVSGIRAVKRWGKFMDRLDEAVKPDTNGRSISDRLDDTQRQVTEIKHQVLTNGGGSLRDSVDRASAAAEEAHAAARDAAEKASRAELVGNMDRADIRHRLNTIETKVDRYSEGLSAHLAEAQVREQTMNHRIDKIEKRSA